MKNSFLNLYLADINFLPDNYEYIEFSYKMINTLKKYNPVITINDSFSVNKKGKLTNIPIDIKDIIATKNILTTGGSKILNNFIPSYNATVVEKLLNEGAKIVSKSNLEELGQGGIGENQYFGNVLNPHNIEYIPGGSSSGAACLVASGAVPISICTDTGDSIRQPAACCGIIGFKPSWGRISRYGVFPYSPSLDTVGLIGRNILDISYVFDIISGYDNKDLTSIKEKKIDTFNDIKLASLRGKKILLIKNINEKLINKEYIEKFNELVNKIKEQGAIIQYKNINTKLMDALLFTYRVISNSESISCCSNLTGLTFGNRVFGKNWKEMFLNTRSSGFGKKVKLRFLLGLYSTNNENQEVIFNYFRKIRRLICEEILTLMKDIDGLIMPFQEFGAEKYSKYKETTSIVKKTTNYIDDNLLLANMACLPSIMIPLDYLNSNKMPVSISLTTNRLNDKKCLQMSYQLTKIINFEYRLTNELS